MTALLLAAFLSQSVSLGPEVMASVGSKGGALRAEPSLGVSGKTVLVAWNDSYGGRMGSSTGVAVGWSYSLDGGKSFELGGYLAGEPVAGADSRIAVAPDGDFYLLVLSWKEDAHTIHVYDVPKQKPTDIRELSHAAQTSGKPYIDKPDFCVTEQGALVVTYASGGSIFSVVSKDEGKSWSKPLLVSNDSTRLRSGCAVRSTGSSLLVAWMEGNGMTATEIWSARSTDGGATYSQARKIATLGKAVPSPRGYRIDAGNMLVSTNDVGLTTVSETTYLSFNEGTDKGSRIRTMTSSNGGATWSQPSNFGLGKGDSIKLFPSIANISNRPAVMYYDRRDRIGTTLTDVYVSVLMEDGEFLDVKLNSVASDWAKTEPDSEYAPFQRNFGDYISLASGGGKLYGAWTDGRSGVPRVYVRSIKIN